MVAINVTNENEDDFNSWYTEEHIPALLEVPGVLSARRYKSSEGTHRYVAIYHLTQPEITKTDAWLIAIDTPWSSQIRPHFQDRIRILARKYERVI